jgi:hypothetical protein
MPIKPTERMATKKDLRMYRTGTSYKYRINLGAETAGVNRLEQFFIGRKKGSVNRLGVLLVQC